jgi:signal peptidase I
MPCWSSCKDWAHTGEPALGTERLDLTDLLEISDLLLRNQTFRLRVASWSMSPALQKGDEITVEPAFPTELLVGDLILYHQNGRLICHRLVATQETGTGSQFITKGDAAAGCGEVIQPDQVLGRVVAVTRRWPWAVSLSKRIDGWLARLRDEVAQELLALQGLRSYRRMMRALLSRCAAYYVGIPEGRRWFRNHRISGRRLPDGLVDHHRLHLVAKLGGINVGSARVTASGEGYWIDDLYVRIRFRGLGVASQLLALAATAAAASGARVLLASVELANTAALRLFTKAGFLNTGDLRGNEVSLRRDL